MKLKLPAIALLAMIMPAQTRAATLTDAEVTFLDQPIHRGRGARTTMHRIRG